MTTEDNLLAALATPDNTNSMNWTASKVILWIGEHGSVIFKYGLMWDGADHVLLEADNGDEIKVTLQTIMETISILNFVTRKIK